MEILNNIGILLSTPNELYTQIFTLPFTFLEIYLMMSLFLTILNINCNKKNKLIYVIAASTSSIISSYTIPNPYNIFFNYLLFFTLILIIFKISPLKAFISVASSVSIFALIGSLILKPYITIFKISTEQLASIAIYKIFYLILMYMVAFIIMTILKMRNLKITLFEDIGRKNQMIIFMNFSFGIITLIIQACTLFYYVNILPIIITFLSFMSLLAYFGISIYSLTSIIKLTLTTKKLESAEEYNKTLHILHDNVRCFKHDFDNIVTTIGGYVRTNDMEGLKGYYLQLEDDCQRVNNLYLLNPEIVNNPRYL